MELDNLNEKNIDIFKNKKLNESLSEFITELKHELHKNDNRETNVLDEYDLYEKRKIFLDNKSKKGNDLAWVTDENSVCLSENGEGGSYFISETKLPLNVKPR